MMEVVAFPYAQFQACVITGKAEVEWPPYNLDLYSLIIPPSPMSWFKYTYKSRWPSMSWRKLLDIEHMVLEQMIWDAMGNIHKKCEACKQAEGNHFESFFQYL